MVFMGMGMGIDMSVFFTLFTKAGVSCWAQSSLSLTSLASQFALSVFCFRLSNDGIIDGPPHLPSIDVMLGFEL